MFACSYGASSLSALRSFVFLMAMPSRRIRRILPSVANIISGISVFLPSQGYSIASVERKKNVVSDVGDTASTVRRCVDGLVKLVVVLNIGYRRSILSTFVVYVDL